jgi:signal transduction histidine kinase
MDINTCFETTNIYHTIAWYSHLVPVALALFLSVYALIKTKFSKLSIAFLAFTAGFSLWLIGDIVTWTSQNYGLVYFTWSWLDFVNIVFFSCGAYFFGVLAREKITLWEKLILLGITIPALVITVTGQSLIDFYQPVCEATENELLTNYKIIAEWIAVALIILSYVINWRRKGDRKLIASTVVAGAILFFFAVFSLTEHVATVTNVYEINLYGLFVLPLFLIAIVFAITNLGVFEFRLLGTQILSYALMIMVGSQFLFLQDITESTLSLITLLVAGIFSALLLQNAQKEEQARLKIEDLAKQLSIANDRLKELDQLKSEFLSIASHQLRAPITAIRGYAANIADGSYGPVPANLKEPLDTMQETTRLMVNSIEDYLNISRIEQGRMKYEKSDFDVADLAKKVVNELMPVAEKKGLVLSSKAPEDLIINADVGKIKQVITNLVDNAIKYTNSGSVTVSVEKVNSIAKITITDTGIGVDPAEANALFEKFQRARGANKVNTTGTGLGLFVAKQLVEGHNGKIRVESDGPGKGTCFIVELPL